MTTSFLRSLRVAAVASVALAAPLFAQKPAAAPAQQSVAGVWTGSVTVPFGDSSIVVPVMYTFTQEASGVGGSAVVPGQGTGAISNFTREGTRVQFRVTVTAMTNPQAAGTPNQPRLLEHDGKLGADNVMEGMVNFEGKPVAKFKISPKK